MSHSSSSLEPQTQSQSSNNQIIDQEEKRDNKEDEESASSSPNRNNHPLANSSPLLTQNLDEFNDINNNQRDAKNSNGIENISSKFGNYVYFYMMKIIWLISIFRLIYN